MDKINIGIIGLGTIARQVHIPVLSTFQDVVIKAAAEVDVKRGEKIAKKLNIPKIYDEYSKLYENEDLDAVFICLPNFLHYEAVKNALDYNLHVFCEKPMSLKSDDAYELVKSARNKSLTLSVGYNRRLLKNYEETSKIVSSLRLGNILQSYGVLVNSGPYAGWIPSSDWFFNDKYGVLYDSAPHLIDLMMQTLSDQIVEVSAMGISTMCGINVFDNIAGVFKTKNKTLGSFNVGWKIAASYDSIQVHGTGGSIFANPMEIEVRYGSDGPLERVADHIMLAKKIIGMQVGKMGGDKRLDETYIREDRSFIDALLNKKKPLVSGEQGLRVLEVLEGIKESINKSETTKIKIHEL